MAASDEWAMRQAVEDLRLGQYLRLATQYVNEGDEIGVYFTDTCTECGKADCQPCIRYCGYVLVGCEGYWLINPEILGLDKGQWSDWTLCTVCGGTEDVQVWYTDESRRCKPCQNNLDRVCGFCNGEGIPPDARHGQVAPNGLPCPECGTPWNGRVAESGVPLA